MTIRRSSSPGCQSMTRRRRRRLAGDNSHKLFPAFDRGFGCRDKPSSGSRRAAETEEHPNEAILSRPAKEAALGPGCCTCAELKRHYWAYVARTMFLRHCHVVCGMPSLSSCFRTMGSMELLNSLT